MTAGITISISRKDYFAYGAFFIMFGRRSYRSLGESIKLHLIYFSISVTLELESNAIET